MIPTIAIIAVCVVLLFVVIVATRPSDFRVTRSGPAAASPEAAFAQVNNFHRWEAWSPWAKMDPAAKNSYDGPADGVGAGFGWDGNKNVGAGHMTITESRPSELIRIRLEFFRPFKGVNTTEFTFHPEQNQTRVVWKMSGKYNFATKAIGLFMNCDRMVGGQFEQGLAAMSNAVLNSARESANV